MAVWVELVCRQCAKHVVGEWTRGGIRRRELRREAVRRRAVFKDGETFCCRDCLRDFQRDEEGGT